ncbi:putative PPPDE peptidase domain-containing protein [Helianthus annuus]|nr:putative PPPDE peptidase domain-containing protein [Helianthus annuus]
MGRESLSSESRSPERDYSNMDTQVFLNVYDLTPVNSYSIWFGFGIFHSGIQVSWFLVNSNLSFRRCYLMFLGTFFFFFSNLELY